MRSRVTKLLTLGVGSVLAAAVVLHLSGVALATPATTGFVSEILARAFFEEIRINTARNDHDRRRDHDDKRDGRHDDDVDANLVKILAKDPSDVYVVRNTVAPGADSGWHTHPGPSVVLVQSGAAAVYEGDNPSCAPVIYPAGSGFVDAGGTHVHLVRNVGSVPLVTVAFQIMPAGAARRIDEPNPGFCPF
jgi:quercetin dioxygenase-like cupin family protein